MMRSMYSAVSGLKNHIIKQDVIGNNIANVNTPAYKYSSANFSDILSQTIQGASAATGTRGGINPMQIGLGMGVASISTSFTDGSYQPTGNNANLGIQGQGFFVLSDGNEQMYSRNGNFDFDPNGNYIMNGTGYKVMGWTADADGNIANTGAISALKFSKGMSMEGKTTTQINFAYNLSKDAVVGSTGMGSITVYDTYGSPHKLTTNFTKVSNDEWLYQAVGDSGKVLPGTQMGIVKFDSNGKVAAINTIKPPTTPASPQTLSFASFQLDSTPNATQKGYFTVYDTNNVMHNYETQITNTGTNVWSYSIVEAGVAGAAPVATGTIAYAVGSGYTQVPAAPSFTLPNAGGIVNFNFLAGTNVPPDVGAFKLNAPATFPKTTGITLDPMQLDSTTGAVGYKNFTVFDENNSPRVFQMKVTTDSASAWKYEITEPGVPSTKAVSGSITWNGAAYTMSPWTISPNQTVAFTVNNPLAPASGIFSMNTSNNMPYAKGASQADIMYVPVNGQAAMNIGLNLSSITHFSSGTTNSNTAGGNNGTTIQALDQDGYSQGTLDSLTVDSSGIVVGKFTNERQKNLGQVALANFNNANGLLKKGDSIYTKTANSGEAQVGAPGSGGRGRINPGTLEMSNVDLSQEFTNMITTQRGFQANSKIISVDDEMLQDLVNLKR